MEAVDLVLGDTRATVLTHGARLATFASLPGHNLCEAAMIPETLETTHLYHGPIIAPVINRLRGAEAWLNGKRLQFEPNQSGRHTLHVGRAGTHVMIWRISHLTDSAVTLEVDLPDGAGGFPGNRRITAAYSLQRTGCLRVELRAVTDAETLMNPGLHPVFHCPPGTTLEVPAERYLPVDDDALPTGVVAEVAGSLHDYRLPRVPSGQTDNNYCFYTGGLRARLLRPDGIWLEIHSDAPGLQVYDGYRNALALEPQLWPDAPAHPHFPSIVLSPGTVFSQTSDYVTGRS